MKQFTHYAHPAPDRPQHCPFLPNPITYGKDTQALMPTDDSPLLEDASKKSSNKLSVVSCTMHWL